MFFSGLILLSMMVSLLFISACSTGKSTRKGPVRSFPDALIEKTNTWRGGAIGASLGSPMEGKIKEISAHASREAAREGKPVAYISLDGFQRVETFPVGKGGSTHCQLVREQIFQEAKLIRDEIKEVCQ
ncbi:MAG: hypothetical protein HY787_14660 [Deltaproteobacteria bacterium]|nr:hypothetical protein [Deltaproteobacteria bacterium]